MDEVRVIRLQGEQSFLAAVRQGESALAQAVQQGVRQVLVDVRELTGFARPSLPELSEMMRRLAETTQGRVKVAFVCRKEFLDEERFGVIVARGQGFDVDAFETEAEAVAWLQEQPGLWASPPSDR
jgi:hypothetical protein